MNRIDIIQSLIQKHGYKKYCEIGVRDGSCFNTIQCGTKVGVDPDPSSAATIKETSDEFFAKLGEEKFDIYYVDGLHISEQVFKDLENCLNHLEEGGTIVMHDCLPTNEFMQVVPMQPEHNEWTGDCWKAFVKLRTMRNDVEVFVLATDWGCGVLRKGNSQLLITGVENPTYADFVANRDNWMNVKSVEWFKEVYLQS